MATILVPPQNCGSTGADVLKLFQRLHIASGDRVYQFEIQLFLSRGPGRGLRLPVAREVLMDLPTPPLLSCSFSLHFFFCLTRSCVLLSVCLLES